MSKNDFDKALANVTKTPTTEDTLDNIYGKKKHTLLSAATRKKPKKKPKEVEVEEVTEEVTEDTVPEGFPEGTILNEDKTLSLPDGRLIQKIEQETSNEEAI